MARAWNRRERDQLRDELAGRLRGEVRFADADRALYSTDASIYQVMPLGVVCPADQEDAARAIRTCLEAGAPVLPRGGGTSLAGQTVGRAVVVDLSRHLDRIVSVDPEARVAVVEPGVVQSQLNRRLAADGLMLGPDTASGSRATLGGMLGNNSSGSHSILYGKTVDAVRRVEAVMSDGVVRRLETIGAADLALPVGHEARDPLERLRAFAETLRRRHGPAVRAAFPGVMRRVSGYNLDALLTEGAVNLASVVVGSEGSLATALEIEVDLVPAPKTKGVALVHFPALEPAIAATNPILATGPSAVELMDDMLLGLAAANPTFKKRLWFMREGSAAVQLVEYFADDAAELAEKFGRLEAAMAALPGRPEVVVAEHGWQVYDAWAVRKAGLPLLSSIPGRRKPLPFVEDTAVDPEKLPAYVARFKEIVDAHDTQAAYYAHASAGCLHIRPLLDLSREEDRGRLESISEAIFALVCEFGGSMSGEHGDGRARSHYNARLFGPEVYGLMRGLKAALDPAGLFNPGQVVDAPAMGDDLRWDQDRPVPGQSAGFSWEREGGFATAVSACNGTAACRQVGEGTMCPTYMATRDEEHSTRGRANLLRSAMNGTLDPGELYGEAVAGALDLCLMCKACQSECPVRVDMAKIKAEWMHWQNQAQGMPFERWALARPRRWLEWGSWAPGLVNAVGASGPGRWAASKLLGLDPTRPPPRLRAGPDPRDPGPPAPPDAASADAPRGPVVLFADTFSCHLDDRALRDARAVLEDAGHAVIVPRLGCCGRPAIGQGDLDLARAQVEANLAALRPYVDAGVPVVGVEPGCLSVFWDEAADLVPGAAALRDAVWHIDEYLVRLFEDGYEPTWATPGEAAPETVGYHPHCHQDALGRSAAAQAVLAKVPGLEVERLGGGCCGMAGDFGYRHPEVAAKVFAQTAAAGFEGPVCSPGWSCRSQLSHHGKDARAPVSMVRARLARSGEGAP